LSTLLQAFPVGSNVYLLGGLTNALEVAAAEGNASAARDAVTDPPLPLVLNATVLYNIFTQATSQQADMPQPRWAGSSMQQGGRPWGQRCVHAHSGSAWRAPAHG
jgi:hypothetical protein